VTKIRDRRDPGKRLPDQCKILAMAKGQATTLRAWGGGWGSTVYCQEETTGIWDARTLRWSNEGEPNDDGNPQSRWEQAKSNRRLDGTEVSYSSIAVEGTGL